LFGSSTRCFDETDQRNRRLRRDLIEDNMRCIRRDQTEICAGARKFVDRLKQVIGHAGEVARVHEIEALPQIDTVDDKFRITPVAGALPIKRDDPLVIIDRAFRPKATDDPKSLHLLTTNPPSLKLRRRTQTRTDTMTKVE